MLSDVKVELSQALNPCCRTYRAKLVTSFGDLYVLKLNTIIPLIARTDGALEACCTCARIPLLYSLIAGSCLRSGTTTGMKSTGRPRERVPQMLGGATFQLSWLVVLLLGCWVTLGYGMTDDAISGLR